MSTMPKRIVDNEDYIPEVLEIRGSQYRTEDLFSRVTKSKNINLRKPWTAMSYAMAQWVQNSTSQDMRDRWPKMTNVQISIMRSNARRILNGEEAEDEQQQRLGDER